MFATAENPASAETSSISPGRMRRGGQDRIERPGTSAVLEQPQAFTQVGLFDDEQRRQQLDVVAGESAASLRSPWRARTWANS